MNDPMEGVEAPEPSEAKALTRAPGQNHALAPASRLMLDVIDKYRGRLIRDGSGAVMREPVVGPERELMTARLNELRDHLKAGEWDNDKAKRAIAYMLSNFEKGAKVDKKEAEKVVRSYLFAVKGRPTIFIEQACRAFASGEVPNHDAAFRPTSAELSIHVKALMERYLAEEYWLRMILTARIERIVSPEERAETFAKMQTFVDEQKGKLAAQHERERNDPKRVAARAKLQEQNLERVKREWNGPRPAGELISVSLAAKLGAVLENDIPDDDREKMVL